MNDWDAIALIPTEIIARVCPREYTQYKFERDIFKDVSSYQILNFCSWQDDNNIANMPEELYQYMILDSKIKEYYKELQKRFKEKTGIIIDLFEGASDLNVFKENEIDKTKIIRKLENEFRDNWCTKDGLYNLNRLHDLKSTLVVYFY
jgi:hypothetical protein